MMKSKRLKMIQFGWSHLRRHDSTTEKLTQTVVRWLITLFSCLFSSLPLLLSGKTRLCIQNSHPKRENIVQRVVFLCLIYKVHTHTRHQFNCVLWSHCLFGWLLFRVYCWRFIGRFVWTQGELLTNRISIDTLNKKSKQFNLIFALIALNTLSSTMENNWKGTVSVCVCLCVASCGELKTKQKNNWFLWHNAHVSMTWAESIETIESVKWLSSQ